MFAHIFLQINGHSANRFSNEEAIYPQKLHTHKTKTEAAKSTDDGVPVIRIISIGIIAIGAVLAGAVLVTGALTEGMLSVIVGSCMVLGGIIFLTVGAIAGKNSKHKTL